MTSAYENQNDPMVSDDINRRHAYRVLFAFAGSAPFYALNLMTIIWLMTQSMVSGRFAFMDSIPKYALILLVASSKLLWLASMWIISSLVERSRYRIQILTAILVATPLILIPMMLYFPLLTGEVPEETSELVELIFGVLFALVIPFLPFILSRRNVI